MLFRSIGIGHIPFALGEHAIEPPVEEDPEATVTEGLPSLEVRLSRLVARLSMSDRGVDTARPKARAAIRVVVSILFILVMFGPLLRLITRPKDTQLLRRNLRKSGFPPGYFRKTSLERDRNEKSPMNKGLKRGSRRPTVGRRKNLLWVVDATYGRS